MQRRLAGVTRRVALVSALALGGSLALAGCRNDPSIAAYVGTETITEAQVEAVYNEATDRARDLAVKEAKAAEEAKANPSAAPSPDPNAEPTAAPGASPTGPAALKRPTRGDIVSAMVLGRACDQTHAKEGFTITAVSPEQAAQSLGLPDSQYVRERAKTEACLNGAMVGVDSDPTDAELRDVYDRAVKGGIELPPFDQVKEELRADEGLRGGLGRKHRVEQMVHDASITLSPRYRPLTWPISFLRSGEPIIIAVVDPGTGAVKDAA